MPTVAIICSSAEAEGMTQWALQFSLTEPDEKLILLGIDVEKSALDQIVEEWRCEYSACPECEIEIMSAGTSADDLHKKIVILGASLVVVGQNRQRGASPQALRRGRALFDQVACKAVLLRLEAGVVDPCKSVLIPSAGGANSRSALRMASRLASRYEGDISPLHVEAPIGEEDGLAVGMRILDRVVSAAGVEGEVHKQVRVSDNVDAAIREAADEGKYDLLLIGASGSGTVRRKLFGTVPDRLIEGEDAMAVAVIRSRRSIAHRFRERMGHLLHLTIPQLAREERIALFDRLQSNSRWNFDFMTLMVLATGIASFGLVQNSPAVVIGAMLVAPLMTPLLGSGLSLVQGNLPLMQSAIRAICFGFLAALAVGFAVGFIAPITELTGELRARGGPTLLDMGVAFLSGIAASYCVARPNLSSALAGVAIAAALVPPIATVGISLALAEPTNARGAALLFGTNVISIILGASLNFFLAGIRAQRSAGSLWVRRAFAVLLVAFAMLLIPLSTVLISKTTDTLAPATTAATREQLVERCELALGGDPIEIERIDYNKDKTTADILLKVRATTPPRTSQVEAAADAAKTVLGLENASIEVRTELVLRGSSGE